MATARSAALMRSSITSARKFHVALEPVDQVRILDNLPRASCAVGRTLAQMRCEPPAYRCASDRRPGAHRTAEFRIVPAVVCHHDGELADFLLRAVLKLSTESLANQLGTQANPNHGFAVVTYRAISALLPLHQSAIQLCGGSGDCGPPNTISRSMPSELCGNASPR